MAAQKSRNAKGERRSCQEKARSTFHAASSSPAAAGSSGRRGLAYALCVVQIFTCARVALVNCGAKGTAL